MTAMTATTATTIIQRSIPDEEESSVWRRPSPCPSQILPERFLAVDSTSLSPTKKLSPSNAPSPTVFTDGKLMYSIAVHPANASLPMVFRSFGRTKSTNEMHL